MSDLSNATWKAHLWPYANQACVPRLFQMQALLYLETDGSTNAVTQRHVSDDLNPQHSRCVYLKSHVIQVRLCN
jgi:hypothetical protein